MTIQVRVETFWNNLPKAAHKALESEFLHSANARLIVALNTLLDLEGLGHSYNDEVLATVAAKLGAVSEALRRHAAQQDRSSVASVEEAIADIERVLPISLTGVIQQFHAQVTPLLEQQREIDKTLSDAQGSIDLLRTRAADAVARNEEKFREAIENLRNQAQEFLDNQKAARDQEIGNLHKFVDDARQRWATETEALSGERTKLEETLSELESRLRLVRQGPAAQAYLDAFDRERRVADALRYVALFLMVAVSTVVGYSLLKPPSTEDWVMVIARFLLVFTLLIPAGYASREASRHRDRAEDYRLRGMGILAVQNYIHDMNPEDATALKKNLARRLLGALSPVAPDTVGGGTNDVIQLAREAVQALRTKEKATE